jgi:hypothetical protein
MRGKILVFLVASLVVSLFALTTLAQVEEQKEQLFVIDEWVVKPPMANEFEAVVKESIAIYAEHKFPYPFYTFWTSDFHYHVMWPYEKYGDLDNWYEAIEELSKKVGEPWQALSKRVAVTYEYIHSSVYYHMPELSYIPENPRLKHEEANFFFFDIYYVQPGKTKEFKEIIKKFVALSKSKNITEGWDAYDGDIGTDMPVYAFVMRAKDETDFYIHNTKMWEILGEEGEKLWEESVALIRKRGDKQAWLLPDFSYMPKEK